MLLRQHSTIIVVQIVKGIAKLKNIIFGCHCNFLILLPIKFFGSIINNMSNKWGAFTLHMNSLRPAMQLGIVTIEQYDETWDVICELLHLSQDEILFEIDRHWDLLPDFAVMN